MPQGVRARSDGPENHPGHATRQVSVKSGGSDERDDQELLEAVGARDRGALRALYDRHAPWLLLRLSRRCADRSIVEEVVQDTFVAVWRRPRGYSGTGAVPAWIWGIGIRRLIDQLRHRFDFGLPAQGHGSTDRWVEPGRRSGGGGLLVHHRLSWPRLVAGREKARPGGP